MVCLPFLTNVMSHSKSFTLKFEEPSSGEYEQDVISFNQIPFSRIRRDINFSTSLN